MAYNVKVRKTEFDDAGRDFDSFCEKISATIKEYVSIIDSIIVESIKAGSVHDALVYYKDKILVPAQNCVEDIGDRFDKLTEAFIGEVKAAADYLVDSDELMDFTQEGYEDLLCCVSDTWCEFTDNIGDKALILGYKIANFTFSTSKAEEKIKENRKAFLDYKDCTADVLKDKFDLVTRIDENYGKSPSTYTYSDGHHGYFFSKFGTILYTLQSVCRLLESATEVMKPGGNFTVSELERICGVNRAELLRWHNELLEMYIPGIPLTVSQIGKFSEQWFAEDFFKGIIAPLTDYMLEMCSGLKGVGNGALMLLFNMFDLSTEVLIENIGKNASLGADKYNQLLLEEDMDYIETHQTNMMKEQLLSSLAGTVDLYQFSESEESKFIETCQTYFKYAGKGMELVYDRQNNLRLGSNGKLLLDGRTREAKMFKEYIGAFGDAQTILEYGSKAIDYVTRLFTDYSKCLVILDSYEKNYDGDEKMKACIGDIRSLYTKEAGAWIKEGLDEVKELGWDVAIEATAKVFSPVAIVNMIGKGIDVAGEVTGLGTKYKNLYDAMSLYGISLSSDAAYRKALDKFLEADPNSEEYEVLASDLSNCFELNKSNIKSTYETMMKATGGTEKAYYSYCVDMIERVSMGDTSQTNLVSYEEYLAQH